MINALLKAKGFRTHEDEENETVSYYTDDSLKHNIIVKVSNFVGEGLDSETIISVEYYNDLDAGIFSIYQDNMINDIQTYRIIADIFDFYNTLSLSDFLSVMNEISVSSMTALMQHEKKNKTRIIDEIKEFIEALK